MMDRPTDLDRRENDEETLGMTDPRRYGACVKDLVVALTLPDLHRLTQSVEKDLRHRCEKGIQC